MLRASFLREILRQQANKAGLEAKKKSSAHGLATYYVQIMIIIYYIHSLSVGVYRLTYADMNIVAAIGVTMAHVRTLISKHTDLRLWFIFNQKIPHEK